MPTTERTGAFRAELYVRDDLPTPADRCRQRIVARLERLAAEGALSGHSVTSWAKRVPIDGERASATERDRFNEFAQWARENDATLSPFFGTRECYSPETGERRTELVMPAACLAVYEGDQLRTVAPHATGATTTSIRDCLDELSRPDAERARLPEPAD